jgi:hypothetical protein
MSGKVNSGRDSARIERLVAPMVRAPAHAQRKVGYLAYWVCWPFTVLEGALMASLSLLWYGLWRVAYSHWWYPAHARQRSRAATMPKIDAADALGAMHTVELLGRESGARIFWISGSLLGLERLGQPLPHDKDLDVGVHVDDPHCADFLRAMWASGDVVEMAPQFVSLKVRIQNPDLQCVAGGVIRYKSAVRSLTAPHQSPTKTDIFLHFPYCDRVMHGTRNSLWWNTRLAATQKSYGESSFSVPTDPHCYLTENYGDYAREVKEFENSIDCPNALNIYSWESLAYLLGRQRIMLRLGRVDRAGRVGRRVKATIVKGSYPLFLRLAAI